MKNWIKLLLSVVLWFAAGYFYAGALVDSWRRAYGDQQPPPRPETMPARGLWTPANELPEVDMRDAHELLPREIYVG